MTRRLLSVVGSLLLGGVPAPAARADDPAWVRELHRDTASRKAMPVPMDALSPGWQETLRRVMLSPTLTTAANAERFQVNDEFYRWLLDHPERVGLAWGRLGVPAVEIRPQADGRFTWTDEQGSELTWVTVAESERGRIWYAEGRVKLGPLLPVIPIRAVAVLHHEVTRDSRGRITVKHWLEAYLQTESKFATLAMRLLGPQAPRIAEQAADQLLMYFSGIARHADAHPDQVETLLARRKR